MPTVNVNPELLKWAREEAGLSVEDATRKLYLNPARGMTAIQRLEALEDGTEKPTRAMLVKMAKQYRRPLVAFYLGAPPEKGDRGQDFRTLPADYSKEDDALVDALIREVKARQGLVRALLEDEEESVELEFIGSRTIENGVRAVSEHLRNTIDLDLMDFRRSNGASKAFEYLRDKVETAGVFVLLIGDLGSHHSQIDVEVFRGFAVADPVAPFIVINDQDARSAWSFTLLHELTHLLLGQSGISGALAVTTVEQFCNDVAGFLLLHPTELEGLEVSPDFDELIENISDFANRRNVSRTMVAYSLYRTQRIGLEIWEAMRSRFRREWLEMREGQRERNRSKQGGPDYYTVRRHRAGKALVNLVTRTLASGALSSSQAGKILGVRPPIVHAFLRDSA